MKIAILEPGKNWLLILLTLVLIPLLGLLVGIDTKNGIYLAGLIGVVGYLFLCIIRPFTAFRWLILLGLTVWVSSIQLVQGISLMVGGGGIFLAAWLIRLISRNTTFITIKEFWYIVGLTTIIVISTLFNWGGSAGFIPIFTYIQLLLLTILVVNFVTSPNHLHQLGHVFIMGSALMAAVILLDQWGISPVGLTKVVESGVYVSNSYRAFERSGGFFGDPNFAALQLTIALPFVIESWPGSSKSLKAWLFLVGLGILLAFSHTVSMGGLAGIASMLLIKTLLVRQRNVLLVIVRAILISWIAFWLAINFLPVYYLDRITVNIEQIAQFLQTYDKSLFLQLGTTRGDAWLAAFQTFMQSPLIGNGPGNSLFINPSNSVVWNSGYNLAAHNFLLSVAGDLGILGLFFFVSLLGSSLWAARPFGSKYLISMNLHPIGDAIFTALLMCVAQGIVLDLHTQKLLWVLVGMALVYKRLSNPSANIPEVP